MLCVISLPPGSGGGGGWASSLSFAEFDNVG